MAVVEAPSLPGPEDPEAALAAVVALRRLAGRVVVAPPVRALAPGWPRAPVGQARGLRAQAPLKKLAFVGPARRGP